MNLLDPMTLNLIVTLVSALGVSMIVLAGVSFLLKIQNNRMVLMNSQLTELQEQLTTLKADVKTATEQSTADRKILTKVTENLAENLIALENRILDHQTDKQSGKRVNEAIRLAQLQTPANVIAEQTGIPYDMAKTIATFHLAV